MPVQVSVTNVLCQLEFIQRSHDENFVFIGVNWGAYSVVPQFPNLEIQNAKTFLVFSQAVLIFAK